MRSVMPWLWVCLTACCPAKPVVDSPPSDVAAPRATASASAAPPVAVAPSASPAPPSCALWSLDDAPERERALYRWTRVHKDETVLSYPGAQARIAEDFPNGYRFHALTVDGPLWLERTGLREGETVDQSGDKMALTQLVLSGDAARAEQRALVLPDVCVKPTSRLRALMPEPAASIRPALERAGKHLDLNLTTDVTTVARAALPRDATFVVTYYRSQPTGYPESAAFTMKDDGTVVDTLLLGETPTHSGAIPFAVDLDGDGVEELLHVHDMWEGPGELHIVGWQDDKPKSVLIDVVND